MNQAALFALLGVPLAIATTDVVYNALDDPRCHEKPSRPVLEPTPGPTNFPPPPGEYRELGTSAPTIRPKCPGLVSGFQVIDPTDSTFTPVALKDGTTLKLSELPATFTVQALVAGSVTEVKFEVDGQAAGSDSSADFTFTDGEFSQLYVEGSYTLSAYASDGSFEPKADECSINVTVDFDNQNVCEGLITNFALYDTLEQKVVPGYEVLGNGQDLDLADLPDHLSIVAIPNGRGGNEIKFYVDGSATPITTTSTSPYAINGLDGNGDVKEWTQLRTTGSYTIMAQMKDRMGAVESTKCEITVHVDSDWICHNHITGFSLLNATDGTVVPGYAHMTGARVIDLAKVPEYFTIRVNKKDNSRKGVKIYLNTRHYRQENHVPYVFNGKSNGHPKASGLLAKPGVYHIMGRGKRIDQNKWEPRGDGCELDLTVVDTSEPVTSPPPDTPLTLIDNNDGPCAPKLVTPVTAGNHQYYTTPVKVEAVNTDQTVKFKVYNYIHDSTMDWMTTAFVTESGVEVCDKVANVDFEKSTEEVYEAKCHEGFAYADVFAYSHVFSDEHISADTSMLPVACKNNFAGKVVRYTFVFSCNCGTTPEVPPSITGGIPVEEMTCAGHVGNSWGDPHVVPFDGGQWDCQGTGEFVLSKATLNNFPYNFEAHARYWRFDKTGIHYSFNTGLVMKQDVKVQLTISEEVYSYSTMFADLPVNFYVDGQPRLLTQGSGDTRVIATVDGMNIVLFFTSTGIAATIHVRPNSVSSHITTIPGSLTTYLCIPDDDPDIVDIMGILGTPNHDTSDDWMQTDGTTISKSSTNAFDYCTNTWCIRNEADSLFTYDAGYNFTYYERCDDPKNTRHLEQINPSAEIIKICDAVDGNYACLYDGYYGGPEDAYTAVRAIQNLEQARSDALTAETIDAIACCSSDFKYCDSGCSSGISERQCASCVTDSTWIWLPHGPYDDPEDDEPENPDLVNCLAKSAQCVGDHECCPGMGCTGGTCSPTGGRRRLHQHEFVFTRPDLPAERTIIPYDEL